MNNIPFFATTVNPSKGIVKRDEINLVKHKSLMDNVIFFEFEQVNPGTSGSGRYYFDLGKYIPKKMYSMSGNMNGLFTVEIGNNTYYFMPELAPGGFVFLKNMNEDYMSSRFAPLSNKMYMHGYIEIPKFLTKATLKPKKTVNRKKKARK